MKQGLLALVAGLVFGIGLAISGMMDPSRVRGFLDIFGAWDPTLAFVMGGASAVMMLVWPIQRRLEAPVITGKFHLPTAKDIDGRLVTGAAMFGVGWGLAGLCPGPGLASLLVNPVQAGAFVLSMIAGMTAFRLFEQA